MAVFSTNQTRHLYVAKKVVTTKPAAVGEIQLVHSGVETPYLLYMGVDGTLMRSDLLTNVESIRVASYKDMRKELQATKVTLNDAAVVGQHYILRVTFKNFIGASDEYTLSVVADYTAKTTDAQDVYKGLAVTLAKNLSKHITPLAEVQLETAEGADTITASTKVDDLAGTYTNMVIVAAKQPWVLGTKSADLVNFEVSFAPITVNGVDTIWGTAKPLASNGDEGIVENGETIADMEYFYMKERADQYGNMGWPNVVATKYLADETKAYNAIDIHYAYVGSNEAIQKSEKDITIVAESTVTGMAGLANSLAAAVKTTAKFTTNATADVK